MRNKILSILFILFASFAWTLPAAAGYYKGQAVANVDDLAEAKKGTVKVLATQNWYEGNAWEEDASSTVSTTDALDDWEDSGWGLFYSVTLYASNAEGAYFGGWYSDEECTILISTANPFFASEGFSSAATEEAAPITTFYAKFVTTEPTNHYAQIQYVTDDQTPKRGAFAYYDPYTWETSYIYEGSTDLSDLNTQTTYTHTNNEVRVIPLRGYRFTSWILTGANAAYSPDYWGTAYGATDNPTYINISSSSNDELNPEVATIQAEYTKLNALTLTMRKAAGRGRATVRYENYEENAGGDGLELKTVSMGEFASANTEKQYTVYESDQITVTAEPASGYSFYGWYGVNSTTGEKTLVSEDAEFTFQPTGNEIYYAYFNASITTADKFQVGMSLCQTLEQALAAVNETDNIILQVNDYTIDGNYTIPAGVTLLIPYSENQKSPKPIVDREVNKADGIPTEPHLTLTLANGATLNVNGTIEVGGLQYIGGNAATDGYTKGTGRPGAYSQLIMSDNSSIILNNGAKLRAWGYITGSGSIDARRGSEVREQFQIMDWKGGTYASGMQDNPQKVFPVNQYFIQNVEVSTKYRPGARLFTSMSVCNDGGTMVGASDNVQIIGIGNRNDGEDDDIAMFLMDDADDSEDTWVRKSYEVANDKQIYDINNSAYLNGITIDLPAFGFTFTSSNYDLPITNNMKIHLLSGEMKITQDVVLLPGSEMQIDKKSTVTINAGKSLYLYDLAQWDNYAYPNATERKVPFRPGGVQNRPALADAALKVQGTFEVEGALYTTAGGANIYSTIADAGTVKFKINAGAGKNVYQWRNSGNKYFAAACTSAQLKNELGTFTPTAGTTVTEDPISFCFIDFDGDDKGEWKSLATDGCFVKDENDVWYIKPQEYVAISQGAAPVEEADHTYRDHYAGTDRIFILAAEGNCQWWEVRAVPGHPDLFECINENNHTFFYYDESAGNWMEKKFKVSWVNWDGTPVNYTNKEDQQVNYYMVTYGTVPEWLSTNPTRDTDASHEYTFDGWMPTPAAVTKDVTYMAQYQERDRMYAITFNDANDELIQLVYCKLGEVPVCSKHELTPNEQWSPAVGAVAGNQTYTLAEKNTDGPFTIRFVNWNGEELQSGSVAKDATPTYNAAANGTPSKPADNSHSYVFVGWTPAIAPATQNMTYTAKYEVEQIIGLNVNTASTLTSDMSVPEVRITTTGSLNITNTAVLTTTNLILEATSDASGQLDAAAENKIDATNVYFDWTPNGEAGTASRTWYAIAVPWEVNAETGIFLKETGRHLVIGQDFDLIYYSGSERASQGNKPSCWKYVQNQSDKIMHPGQLYMMYFDPGFKTIRFAKKTGSAVLYTNPVSVSTYSASDNKDANWNGIANPKTYYASLSAGTATYAQVLNNGNLDDYFANPGAPVYQTINLASSKFTVGKPLFVQATEATSVVVTKQTTAGIVNAAPRRAAAELPKGIAAVYRLAIAGEDQPEADNLFVQVAEDEKADRYTIGQDLVKGGVASGRAQVWVNRYDAKLSVNTQALSDGEATYPLTIQVPANGDYVLSVGANENEDYALYLTRDGEAIWNLSEGAYTANLEKGAHTNYGLRVSARAPQITTGIDEAVVDAKGETRKVLINNTVYIIRGENVYSTDGQLVK